MTPRASAPHRVTPRTAGTGPTSRRSGAGVDVLTDRVFEEPLGGEHGQAGNGKGIPLHPAFIGKMHSSGSVMKRGSYALLSWQGPDASIAPG